MLDIESINTWIIYSQRTEKYEFCKLYLPMRAIRTLKCLQIFGRKNYYFDKILAAN